MYTRHHHPSIPSTIYSGKAAVVAAALVAGVFLAQQPCVQSDSGRRPQAAAIAVQPATPTAKHSPRSQSGWQPWAAVGPHNGAKRKPRQQASTAQTTRRPHHPFAMTDLVVRPPIYLLGPVSAATSKGRASSLSCRTGWLCNFCAPAAASARPASTY